jgi:hypothetical protein
MRYYFAGAYARRAELAGYRDRMATTSLGRQGAAVVSRWLDQDQDAAEGDGSFCAEMLHLDSVAERAWEYGQRDLEDLSTCDAIVSFTGSGTRGGRHIEHGVAISYHDNHPWDLSRRADPLRLILVGPREHVFHCHPATEVYPDFEAFLQHEIAMPGWLLRHREETR